MAVHAKKIYVEIRIVGEIERIWQLTQTPDLHQRWDLRFSEIRYLPRPDPSNPQRFRYTTRIGFGLKICGEGESTGTCDGLAGERTSALKFWSEDPKSLIREGSGYWKYFPAGSDRRQVRFVTAYDYTVRFGALGRWFDLLIWRRLMGWATAWSFDRLRLWIEKGIDPATSIRQCQSHVIARAALALLWLYEGVVPKLLFRHPGELAMIRAGGFSQSAARSVCIVIGWMEVIVGLAFILAWHSRWPAWVTMIAMPVAIVAVGIKLPEVLVGPFNPIALNLSVFALAVVVLLTSRDLPSARHCRRQPSRSET